MRRALAAIYIVLGIASVVVLFGIVVDRFSTTQIVIFLGVLAACAVAGTYLEGRIAEREIPAGPERDYDSAQAVTIYIRDNDLPAGTDEFSDIMGLEMLLEESLEDDSLGWYDGDAAGPDEWILYLYGPDAEALFAAIEPVLCSYPLCRNARVEIEANGPDGAVRTVILGAA